MLGGGGGGGEDSWDVAQEDSWDVAQTRMCPNLIKRWCRGTSDCVLVGSRKQEIQVM